MNGKAIKKRINRLISFVLTLALVLMGMGTFAGLSGILAPAIKVKAEGTELNHAVTAKTSYLIGDHYYTATATADSGDVTFIAVYPTSQTYSFNDLSEVFEADGSALDVDDAFDVVADLDKAGLIPALSMSTWQYDTTSGTVGKQGFFGVPNKADVEAAMDNTGLLVMGTPVWTSTKADGDNAYCYTGDSGALLSTDDVSQNMKVLVAFKLNLSAEGVHTYASNGSDYITHAVPIDEEHFPDANFRNWVLAQSYGSDGKLTASEIAGVKAIDVSGKSIADLTGIEYFTALDTLTCNSNNLTTLDMSNNIALGWFYCNNNQLATLDVSQNIALKYLDCNNNQLTTLDVNQNTALKSLDCSGNSLTTLDLSNNMALESLDCNDNLFATLKVNFTTSGGGVVTISNGGRGILPVSSTYISSKGITLLNPTADDYTFTGWTTTGNITQSGNSWKSFTIGTGDATITATWLPIYTVTYVDGQGNTLMTRTVTEGSATPAYTGTPQRDGYTFAGWSPSVASTVTESVTYTATWDRLFTVKFVDGFGTTLLEETVTEGSTTPAYSGTPERSGYTFAGWTPTVADTVTADVTYTATWKQNFTVTYADGQGNTLQSTTVAEGSATPTYSGTPEREGYTFAGWTPEIADTVTADVTYTATWKQNFTVKYVDGQGNTLLEETVAEGSATPTYSGTPTREGYTFTGWTPEAAPTVTADATYTATWTQNAPTTHTITIESRFLDKDSQHLNTTTRTATYEEGETVTIEAPAVDGYFIVGQDSVSLTVDNDSTVVFVYQQEPDPTDPTDPSDPLDYDLILSSSLKMRWQGISGETITRRVGNITITYGSKKLGRFAGKAIITVDPTKLPDGKSIKVSIPTKNIILTIGGVEVAATVEFEDTVFDNTSGSRQLIVTVITDRSDLPYDDFFGKPISGSIAVSVEELT